MGASQATAGYGVVLNFDPNGGSSYTGLAEMTDVQGPDGKWNTIDVSNMGSPGAVEEYILGMLNPGGLKVKANFLPGDSSQKAATTAWTGKKKCSFQITWTDSGPTLWTFKGFFISIVPGGETKGKLQVEIEIKVTGVVTLPT